MKKWTLKSRRGKVAAAVCAVLLLSVLAAYFYVDGMLSKINYSTGTISQPVSEEPVEEEEPDAVDSSPQEIESAEQAIADHLKEESTDLTYDKAVWNILLIGCDSQSGSDAGRSDSMILLSVNKNTKKIVMTSIMRDIYTAIPGHGNNRINAAFALGGAKLLLTTVEQDFEIKVDHFAVVNFFSFMDIVDKLGGVTISVSEKELTVLNKYVRSINDVKGIALDDGLLPQAGENLKLTGKQALAYCRIRYVGNADYERTERQRRVLTQILGKVKGLGILELNDLLNLVLPSVTTNLTKGELYSLILSAPALSQYGLEQDRIPIDGSYRGVTIRKMSVLSINFQKNIEEIQKKIYGR